MKLSSTAILLAVPFLLFAAGPLVALRAQDSPASLSVKEFQQLHAELAPKEAAWTTIPWETSLIKAQNLALRDGKPIFIWSMDGHPLGCT